MYKHNDDMYLYDSICININNLTNPAKDDKGPASRQHLTHEVFTCFHETRDFATKS